MNEVPEVPVYYPTAAEFNEPFSFSKIVHKLQHDPLYSKLGLCIIQPPNEFHPRPSSRSYNDIADSENIHIRRPIIQQAIGSKGTYFELYIEQKSMSLRKFKEKVQLFRQEHGPKKELENMPTGEIERHYWRNIQFRKPMYGADLPGSLFEENQSLLSSLFSSDVNLEEKTSLLSNISNPEPIKNQKENKRTTRSSSILSLRSPWNPARLEGSILHLLGPIPGVNIPYLYFGCWGASFAWHTEDMDLYSINYIHFGAPKTWYCILPEHKEKFENLCRMLFPAHFQDCQQFLRHKQAMISPDILRRHGINYAKCTHFERQFVIVFPAVYHAGFNHGWNCAESVNFALESWIPIGKRAKACTCQKDSVHIDIGYLENIVSKNRPFCDQEKSSTPRKKRTSQLQVTENGPATNRRRLTKNSPG